MERHVDSIALAELIANGDRFADLSRPTKALAQDRLFRIWRPGGPVLLKVYGTPARARREAHALQALAGIKGVPVPVDSGIHTDVSWALFVDPGEWSLGQLPENHRLGVAAGQILRAVHDSDPGALSNLARGIDAEWVAVDFASTMRRLNRYRAKLGIDVELYETARSIPTPFASAPRGTHTDPSPENFVVDEYGGVTLTNWQWATLAPPEWDLAGDGSCRTQGRGRDSRGIRGCDRGRSACPLDGVPRCDAAGVRGRAADGRPWHRFVR
jgi:aminoglycoside phosphotransferase (APT) family kinase protein